LYIILSRPVFEDIFGAADTLLVSSDSCF